MKDIDRGDDTPRKRDMFVSRPIASHGSVGGGACLMGQVPNDKFFVNHTKRKFQELVMSRFYHSAKHANQ